MRVVLSLLLAGSLAAGWDGWAGEEERLPWNLEVRIEWGAGAGSRSLLEEAAKAMRVEMRERGCFRECSVPLPGETRQAAGVVLDVVLSGFEEETRYDQSMAERMHPVDAAAVSLGHNVRVEASVEMRLGISPGPRLLRADSYRASEVAHPRTIQDDARGRARLDFVREVAKRARTFVCKGSTARLEERIRTALAGSGETSPSR